MDLISFKESLYSYQMEYDYRHLDTYESFISDLNENVGEIGYNIEDFDDIEELKDAIGKVFILINNLDYYDGYIELNDNRTLWEINKELDMDDYSIYVESAVKEFENMTGVTLYLLGRGSRHICVENTYKNAERFEELCNIQHKLETKLINTINNGD